MKSKKNLTPKNIAGAVIGIIALVAVVVIFLMSRQNVQVELSASGIEIKGMYGVRVDFSDINSVILVEKSMKEIGYGKRTNGSDSGGNLRGHFEDLLLFVVSDSSPTIHITRGGEKDIYISLSDSQETKSLYNEIISVWGN